MSKLNELILQLCPDGVEYKKLSECCTLEKGSTPIQKAVPGQYPLVVTTEERKSSNTYQFEKPTVCIPLISSRGHGVASLSSLFYQEGKFALGNILCGVTPVNRDELSAKFLFYYLNHKKDTLIVPLMRGGANVSLTIDSLKKVRVPIPPMSIQNEVIRILDKFEAFRVELAAELTARKQQYEYYCRSLIDTAKDAVETRIGDFGKWSGGMTPSMSNRAFWEKGTIPWISSKDMKQAIITDTQDHITQKALAETSIKLMPKETVAIVARSGILKHTLPIAYIPVEVTVNQDIKILVPSQNILPKFAYYCLIGYQRDLLAQTKKQGGTVDSLEIDKFMDFQIPVPPIAEQERIMGILTRFDDLCNNLSAGLPAEIDARRKQYEFYRDKLLLFKEVGKC